MWASPIPTLYVFTIALNSKLRSVSMHVALYLPPKLKIHCQIMHLQALVLTLPFICPSSVIPLMASICQLPSLLTLWSAGRGRLGRYHRESWAVCWCSVSNKCPISFSIIWWASSISLADLRWGFKVNLAGRHSTLRQKQVRMLSVCPAWKWLLELSSLSIPYLMQIQMSELSP